MRRRSSEKTRTSLSGAIARTPRGASRSAAAASPSPRRRPDAAPRRRCCAEKRGDCLELNINAVVSVCLAFVLFCTCLLWCCCRCVPGCPVYNRRAERRADKMDEEA